MAATSVLNSYKIEVHFHSLLELNEALCFLMDFHGKNQDYEVFLHWQPHTLKKDFLLAATLALDKMRRKNGSVRCYLPLCFEDSLKITTFPDCSKCVLGETGHCQYPTHTRTYYPALQTPFTGENVNSISRSDFEAEIPPTWLIPSRRQIRRLVQIFQNHSIVVDFGCGNGFIDTLLLQEGLMAPIRGVDPLVEPKISHPLFRFEQKLTPPSIGEDWALFSSLGDHRVPLQEAIQYRPSTIGMFVFTDVFGLGGSHFHGLWKEGKYEEKKIQGHFSFADLEAQGYSLLEQEETESPFFPGATEFRLYSLKPGSIPPPNSEAIDPFPWENTADRRSPISTFDLS